MTPAAARLLAFLRAHLAEQGYPPTLREIASHFGWHSTQYARELLRTLEGAGHIVYRPDDRRRGARALNLLTREASA